MTTFLLIRHATNDLVGKALAGRMPGVHLNAEGWAEAEQLAVRLADVTIDALYTSPRERTQETAAPLVRGRAVETLEGIDEVDFGEWTGRTFLELKAQPEWAVWVTRRSAAIIPGGERLAQVQRRFTQEMERLASAHPGQTVALFSHGEPIKTALAQVLGLALDHLDRFDIAPASVSIVVMEGAWMQVRLVNGLGALG